MYLDSCKIISEDPGTGLNASTLPNMLGIIYIDTLPLCKRLYPGRTYYNQPSLARTFNILIDGAHRAMSDVIVLEQLYYKILNDLQIREKICGEPESVRVYIRLEF